MVQYTFKDIEVFLLDDDLFQWAKSGFADNGFDIESYKLQHPGCEERIELAIAVIRSMKVVEDTESTSQAYKMQSFNRMMNKLHSQDIKSVQPHRTHSYRKVIVYVASIAAFLLICLGSYYWISNFKVQEEVELTADMIDSLSRSDQVQVLLDGKQAVGLDKNNAEIRVDENGTFERKEFMFLFCIDGEAEINGTVIKKGETIFIPCDYGTLTIKGKAEFGGMTYRNL